MRLAKFHSPHPNDGINPHAFLPRNVVLSMEVILRDEDMSVEAAQCMIDIAAGKGYQTDVYGDVLSLTQVGPDRTPLNHWRLLHFKELPNDQKEPQAEHGQVQNL